jgi:hypothetical protein
MTTTANVTVTNTWSADLSDGASNVLIQRRNETPVLIYVGASAPANTSLEGIELIGEERVLSLGNPAFTAADKCFARTYSAQNALISVVKG